MEFLGYRLGRTFVVRGLDLGKRFHALGQVAEWPGEIGFG
jgi:hypothetical protein